MTRARCPRCGKEVQIEGTKVTKCSQCGQSCRLKVQSGSPISPRANPTPSDSPNERDATEHMGSGASVGILANTPPALNLDATVDWSSSGEFKSNLHERELTSFLSPPMAPDEIGRLGSYRILKILGAGGMGVVFHAEDTFLNRPVALKAMLPGIAIKQANRLRFLREARAAAGVRHEHVVTIYQVGEQGGVPYLSMEFLEGALLEDRLRREKHLPLPETVRIARETAEGLAAAHDCGLVHRDIKPANLWLLKPRGRVIILDFGLARAMEDDSNVTRTGIILGTPAYMSPEQARTQPVDARSDLFSLGVILYRMVTGIVPFRAPDMLAVLMAVTSVEPTPVWELNPDLPWTLSHLIMQLLAKDPDQRPASAAEVAQTLASIEAELAPPAASKTAPAGILGEIDVTAVHLQGEPNEILSGAADDLTEPEVEDVEVLSGEPPILPADRLSELTGYSLGSYLIGEVLGTGHHGVVFSARDERSGETVALKVFPPSFPATEQEIQRFSQTLRTWMPLRHPNLVTLFGGGRSGPYCWLATDYIVGKSLTEFLPRVKNKGDFRLALRVTVHIAQALECIRAQRIIHGNVTFGNILVRDADKMVLLNDVQLMSALRGSRLKAEALDQKLAAERAHLAPEQVDAGTSFVDLLVDIYSLGTIAYRLATGKPVFRSDSLEDAIPQILQLAPTRPTRINKSLPREFESVLLRMLAKRQEDRYQFPADLLADLQPLVRGYGID